MTIKRSISFFKVFTFGGRGSGHHGHAGRPGQVGGSAPSHRYAQQAIPVGAKSFKEYQELIKKRGTPYKWKKGIKDKQSLYGIEKKVEESNWDDFDVIVWSKRKSLWSDEIEFLTDIPEDLQDQRFQIVGTYTLMKKLNHKDFSLKEYGFDWAKTEDPEEYIEIVETMTKEELDKNSVFLRMTPGKLNHMLSEGEYKNMFQRGGLTSIKTDGKNFTKADYWDKRIEGEELVLGVSLNTPHEMRPVYGYLSKTEHGRLITGPKEWNSFEGGGKWVDAKDPLEDDFWLEQYGSVSIRLKPHIKERTTWTGSDSLDSRGTIISSSMTNPSYFSLPEAYQAAAIVLSDQNGKSIDSDWGQYWEAQVFGGVTLEDIDHVYMKTEPNAGLKRKLEKEGIPWTVTG